MDLSCSLTWRCDDTEWNHNTATGHTVSQPDINTHTHTHTDTHRYRFLSGCEKVENNLATSHSLATPLFYTSIRIHAHTTPTHTSPTRTCTLTMVRGFSLFWIYIIDRLNIHLQWPSCEEAGNRSSHLQRTSQLHACKHTHTHTHTHTGFYTVTRTHKKTHTFPKDDPKALARKTSSHVWSRARKCPPSEVSQTHTHTQ